MTENSNVIKNVPTESDDTNGVIDDIDEDLLDSAFEDIAQSKTSKTDVVTVVASDKSTVVKEKSPTNTASSQNSTPSSSLPKDEENLWSEEYFKQMTQDLEKNMESFVNGDSSHLDSLLEEMMNNVNLTELDTQSSNVSSSSQAEQSLEDKLKESVEELTRGIKNLPMNNLGNLMRGDPGSNADSADAGASANMMPFLEDIMQQFLSKEVLYPVFSETVAKYPEWLETNKATLSEEQFENYSRQNEIMSRVVAEFDTESPGDSTQEKKSRFNRILELLQRMQEYGAPPKDLVGEDSFPAGDLAAMGGPGGLGSACSIM